MGSALLTLPARAQTRAPDVTQELKLFESTEGQLDPLGLDENTGKGLDEAAEALVQARERAARQPKPANVLRGEILSGLAEVTESAHSLGVRLAEGLAFVQETVRLDSRSDRAAEVAYRLALPSGAVVHRVQACQGRSCREARTADLDGCHPETNGDPGAVQLTATTIRDTRGEALALRVSSVDKQRPLELRVEYVAEASVRGGVVHLVLPGRGEDARAALTKVNVEGAPEMVLSDYEVELDPARSLKLRASMKAGKTMHARSTGRCAGRPCSREFRATAPRELQARETWLLVDASPSVEGVARNRADQVLTALLSSAPPAAPLRVFAFASAARELGRFTMESAPLKVLSDALLSDLGSSTRPARALSPHLKELSSRRPLVLVLSDGKLDTSALRELGQLRGRGAELWLLQLAETSAAVGASFQHVLDLSQLDGRSEEAERLQDALKVLYSPSVQPGLRAGEQSVREQRPAKAYVPEAGAGWLSFWLAGKPATFVLNGTTPGQVIAGGNYTSTPEPPPPDITSMPKESVLNMLRTQLIPQARGCLRVDRKGRADYAVALTFHALFADREAYDVRIDGNIAAPLRACLDDVVAKLRIPAFAGRIRVRYPIHTEREPEPPVIELLPDAREQVDRVIQGK